MINKESVSLIPPHAVYKRYNGSGPAAHFYHANGFPLGVYEPLLKRLSGIYDISGLVYRAMWPEAGLPAHEIGWQAYADDLIGFIDHQYQTPVIGIGHSMGATCTVLAATKRPDLFSHLILIEPAILPQSICTLLRLVPKRFLSRIEPVRSALKKRDTWPSRDSFQASCKKRYGDKQFSEEALLALCEHGVKETDDGQFQLTFPKDWEAHNYTKPVNILKNLFKLKTPCLAIRGEPSLYLREAMWKKWQVLAPNTVFKEHLASGHLLPLENPSACFDLIQKGLPDIS